MSGRGGRPARNGILPRPWQRRDGEARGRTGAPCHDSAHGTSRITYVLPDDFPQRLERFQEESGLSWLEIARRIGTYRHTVWRWKEGRVRPNYQHRKALLELTDSMGLGHLFTD